MKLSECRRGEVVKIVGNFTGRIFSYEGLIGHIGELCEDDAIARYQILVKVECSNGNKVSVLPVDLELYQDQSNRRS